MITLWDKPKKTIDFKLIQYFYRDTRWILLKYCSRYPILDFIFNEWSCFNKFSLLFSCVCKAEMPSSSNQQEVSTQCISKYTGTKEKEIQKNRYRLVILKCGTTYITRKLACQKCATNFQLCNTLMRTVHSSKLLAPSLCTCLKLQQMLNAILSVVSVLIIYISIFFLWIETFKTKKKEKSRKLVQKERYKKRPSKDEEKSSKDGHKPHKDKLKQKRPNLWENENVHALVLCHKWVHPSFTLSFSLCDHLLGCKEE